MKQQLLSASVWQPAQDLQEHLNSTSIININAHKKSLSQGTKRKILSKLRDIYRAHLKQHLIIRTAVRWSWYIGYPLYQRYILVTLDYFRDSKQRKWRNLIKLSDFVEATGLSKRVLEPAEKTPYFQPVVTPLQARVCLQSDEQRDFFPEVVITIIPSALVYGGTNFISVGEDIVCHDLFDWLRDTTSEELHQRAWIKPSAKRIRWMKNDEFPAAVPTGAIFTDACATNYAHWMSEVLPRIALFCAQDNYEHIPIIVDAGLHQNIMDSLLLVTGLERKIITLPVNRALKVDQLYATSVAGYVPFGQRKRPLFEFYKKQLTGHSQGIFSAKALSIMRDNIIGNEKQNTPDNTLPSKIFLRRRTGTRCLVNSDEVESFFVGQGFSLVEPETLTFLQQRELFRHAKIIASPTGAALANALLCQPKTQVIVLMAKHEDMIYRYWANMLSPLNIVVSYVLGEISNHRDLGIHGDFSVAINDLKNLLETLGEK